jgi:GAF domain-containing protein
MRSDRREWSESERLAALERYRVLDTAREPEFDGIARLASLACEAPIALVNFLTSDRQWFKAEVGAGRREAPLGMAFCAQAMLQPELLIVPDATRDPRFDGNPLVTEPPHVRFYAGALVRTPEGVPVGTVCVLDPKARHGLTLEQCEVLVLLAQQVRALLRCRLATNFPPEGL